MLRGGCLGFGVHRGVQSRAPGVLALNALSLNTSSVAESAAVGAVVGTLQGVTTGSTLTLTDSATGLFALNGSNIEVAAALDWETATSHNITVEEAKLGYSNTPRSTVITITVTNVLDAATLVDLALDNNDVPEDSVVGTVVGAVINDAVGSTVTLTDDAGGKFSYNSGTGNIQVAGALSFASSPYSIELTETLADSPNSPHVTTLEVLATDVTPSDLSAITLTQTTAATTNPLEWDSTFTGYEVWDGVDTGDQHRLVFTLDGVETVEAWQGLDDELLSGGFTWPLWEAAKPFAGGTVITVKEQRRRLVGGVQTAISDYSNVLTDTMAAVAWTPDYYFTGTEQGAYYDVSDISTLFQDTAGAVPVTASGDTVLRINDLSGNGHHLISSAGQGPIYRTNGGAGANKPYLDFDGVNDFFATASFASKAQPHYQAIAGKFDNTTVTMTVTDGILNGARAGIIGVDTTADIYLWGGSAADTGLNYDTSDVVIGALFNGASSKGWKDGVAGAAINADTNGVTGLTLGSAFNATSWFDGRVYGLFVAFSAEPDATAKANVTTWLGNLQGRSL